MSENPRFCWRFRYFRLFFFHSSCTQNTMLIELVKSISQKKLFFLLCAEYVNPRTGSRVRGLRGFVYMVGLAHD
jgi:hypothetical protein